MDTLHRRVDVQSPADLEYLAANITEAAQKKIDLHIPPSSEDSTDTFRKTVNELVHEYVRETLHLALPSIAINGMDASPAQLKLTVNGKSSSDDMALDEDEADAAAYEPYDQRLATQLRDLYAALETETTKVAGLRRDAPARAAQQYLDNLNQEVKQYQEDFQEHQKKVREAASNDTNPLADFRLERQDAIKSTWEDATSNLEKLREITEAVAVLERAKVAAKETNIL